MTTTHQRVRALLAQRGWNIHGDEIAYMVRGEAVRQWSLKDEHELWRLLGSAQRQRHSRSNHYRENLRDSAVGVWHALLAVMSLADVLLSVGVRIPSENSWTIRDDEFEREPALPRCLFVLGGHPATARDAFVHWLRLCAEHGSSANALLPPPTAPSHAAARGWLVDFGWREGSGRWAHDGSGESLWLDDAPHEALEAQLEAWLCEARRHRGLFVSAREEHRMFEWAQRHAAIVAAVYALYAWGARGNETGIADRDIDDAVRLVERRAIAPAPRDAALAHPVSAHRAKFAKCETLRDIFDWTDEWVALVEETERRWISGDSTASLGEEYLQTMRFRRRGSDPEFAARLTDERAARLCELGFRWQPDGLLHGRTEWFWLVPGSYCSSIQAFPWDMLELHWRLWRERVLVSGVEAWRDLWLDRWSLLSVCVEGGEKRGANPSLRDAVAYVATEE
jgi:hypothetical protein